MATAATTGAELQQTRLAEPIVMPTLQGIGYGNYNAQPDNFILSFLLHTLGVFGFLVITHFLVSNAPTVKQNIIPIFTDSSMVLPPGKESGGGGGGGEHDKLDASNGKPPKFKMDEITQPTAIIRNLDPKLVVDQSVMVPDVVKMPTSQTNVGDPMSNALALSNGTGLAGIGSGSHGGIGSGNGHGIGPGLTAGIGGDVFRVGGGVTAPKPIYSPDPDYSDEARKVKYQGTVILRLIIDANGRPRDIAITRGVGLGLDEKAIEAVRTWRFEPAKKDGKAVAVAINVEVNFNLY